MSETVYTICSNGLVCPKPKCAGYMTIGLTTFYVNEDGYKDNPPRPQSEIDLENAIDELNKEFPGYVDTKIGG